MKQNAELRQMARQLRTEKYMSLGDIAAALSVPKTTAYYWLKDIQIPRRVTDKQKLNQQRGALANQAKYAARRKAVYDAAHTEAPALLSDQNTRDFVVLYLAEGYRRDRNQVSFCNSNPSMIRFAHGCMRRLATNQHFHYSFQFHADQDPQALKAYWASQLEIDPQVIVPVPKTNSGHLAGRRFNCEYGVFMVRVGDTRFRAQLQALMDAVQQDWVAQ